jgi:uncharacterized protein (TIGR02231 family)
MSFSGFRYLSAILVLSLMITASAIPCASMEKPKEAQLKTDVISATVYRGQAQVKRSGSLPLKKGQFRIFCDDLPAGFDHSSLQVEGHGTAKVSIVGTDIIRVQDDPAETPKYRELMEKLENLQIRGDSIGIEINALQVRLQFVEQLGKLPMQQNQAEEFPSEVFQVEGWKALMDFLQSERTGAEAKVYTLNRKRKKIREDINWIQNELNRLKQGTRSGNRVVIECAVESAGDLALDLTYIVQGTAWVPEYRISFDPEEKQVALTYNARLKQRTGENWKGIDITLSTAMPHAGAAPPKLLPHYISKLTMGYRRTATGEMEEQKVGRTLVKSASVDEEDATHLRAGRADHFEAEIVSSEFAASFKVPAKIDLETGAESKRIRITEGTMPARLSLYTAPRLRDDIFIRGMVTNSLGAPILAGVSEVYIDTKAPGGGKGSTFVGKQQLNTFADGQEFPLHLGVDQEVKVKHKLEKREYVEKEGKKWKKIRYHYLITIENFKKETAGIVLQDRIPVSTMKELKIEKVDISLKPDEEREDGVVTWNLKPAAGEKIEIRIAYTIAFPGDWPEHSLNLE